MFRKEFALFGAIFGLFLYASIAFPGGVVQSVKAGTANVPTAESVGGWGALIGFLFFIAASLLIAVAAVGALVLLIKRKNLEEVALAYNVGVESLRDMEPMQACEALNEKYPRSVLRSEEASGVPAYVSRGVYIAPAFSFDEETV